MGIWPLTVRHSFLFPFVIWFVIEQSELFDFVQKTRAVYVIWLTLKFQSNRTELLFSSDASLFKSFCKSAYFSILLCFYVSYLLLAGLLLENSVIKSCKFVQKNQFYQLFSCCFLSSFILRNLPLLRSKAWHQLEPIETPFVYRSDIQYLGCRCPFHVMTFFCCKLISTNWQ